MYAPSHSLPVSSAVVYTAVYTQCTRFIFFFFLLSLDVLCVQYIIQCADYIFLHGFSSAVFTVSILDSVGIYCSSVAVGSTTPWSWWLTKRRMKPLILLLYPFLGSSWRYCLLTTRLLTYYISRPPFCFMRWYNQCAVVGVPLLRRFWSLIPFRLLPGPRWCLFLLTLLAVHAPSIEWVSVSFSPPFRAVVIFKLVKFRLSHQLWLCSRCLMVFCLKMSYILFLYQVFFKMSHYIWKASSFKFNKVLTHWAMWSIGKHCFHTFSLMFTFNDLWSLCYSR